MELRAEAEGAPDAPPLPNMGADMVAFMSFAVVRGFGATHPLIALADRLHDAHQVRMGPLTTFYEGLVEDSEDAEKLEMAWQDARDLADALAAMQTGLESDEQCQVLLKRAGTTGLPDQVRALHRFVADAAEAGRRVRLSYTQ